MRAGLWGRTERPVTPRGNDLVWNYVADNWLNLRRLELAVYVDNEPGIRLYRKFGFEIEGTRRGDAFRDGKFVDSFAMARWRRSTSLARSFELHGK